MRRTHLVLAAIVLALTLALSGCGSGGGDGGGVASAGGKSDATSKPDEADMGQKFAECLRDNGLDVQDPEPGQFPNIDIQPGTSNVTVDKAMEACREYDPAQNAKKLDPKRAAENLKMSQCMRKNGVENFPDPGADGGIQMDGSIEKDPDFKAADEKCNAGTSGRSLNEEGKKP